MITNDLKYILFKSNIALLVTAILLFSNQAMAQAEFIVTYNTTNPGATGTNSFRIPAVGGLYDVDLGNDGSFELIDQTGSTDIDVTAYALTAGIIQVAIRNAASGGGDFVQIQFNSINDHTKLISIDQWGSSIGWTNMNSAFEGCSNMDVLATDAPDLSAVTDFRDMFWNCSSLVGTTAFNSWNVGSGTLFNNMFRGANSFNQDIGNWNVGNGLGFGQMFRDATSFNQDIGAWNVGNGTFFAQMFQNASSFNQDIGNWNVSLGTSFNRMFAFASSFNQDIGNWNVGSGVNFGFFFELATSFNQDIGAWDVSNGTGFNNIFNGATSFDQDLGAWNVGNMVTGNAMFNNSGMSQNNWDTTLIGWEAQAFSNSNINIGAVGLSFCYATVERDNMINAGIFSFTGDALSCPPPTLHGKGPGGIGTNDGASSLELWIDPDLGVTTNSGILVNSILDQSGNGLSFSSSGTTRPDLLTGPNGRSYTSYLQSNPNRLDLSANIPTIGTGSNRTILYVFRFTANLNNSEIFGTDTTAMVDYGNFGLNDRLRVRNATNNQTSAANSVSQNVWHIGSISYNGTNTVGRNDGTQILNSATNAFAWDIDANFSIGSSGFNSRSYTGGIAEVILHSRVLNTTEQIISENYLSAKYGLTLGVNDIYNEDDAGNGNYDFDVAGIGRVNATNIHNDAQGTGIVRILNPTGLDDDEFLIWGHDNGAQQLTNTSDIPAGVQARFDRVWRVSEASSSGTGVDVGAVDIQFDFTGLYPIAVEDLRLLVDTDNDGSFSDETPITGATSLGGSIFQFAGVSAIADNLRFTVSSVRIPTPGGVGPNLALWLKADDNGGVTTDGTTLTTWKDNSVYDVTLTGTSSPSYEAGPTELANFNPVVNFDGDDHFHVGTAIDFQTSIMFGVGKASATGTTNNIKSFYRSGTGGSSWPLAVNGNSAGYLDRVPNTLRPSGLTWDTDELALFRTTLDLDNTPANYAKNGSDNSATVNVALSGDTYSSLGNQSAGGRSFGDIAETIIYNVNTLTPAEVQQIESYLALKYGITLDQTTSQDYMASDGSTKMWSKDATNAATYNNDIFGIGRDDNSVLNQKQSKSVNTDALVTVGLGSIAAINSTNTNSFATNLNFITLGNNDGNMAFTTTGAPSSLSKLARQWQVQETGTVGTVTIRIPDNSSTLSTKLPTANQVYLMRSTDTDFSDETPELMTLNGTDWEISVNVADGTYLTFATNIISVEFTELASSDTEKVGGNLPTITVSGGVLANDATIEVALDAASTAIAPNDFTFTSPLTIPAGDYTTPQSIDIGLIIVDDVISEPDEIFMFTLQNPTGVATIDDADGGGTTESTITYTIIDDDPSVAATGTLLSGIDLSRLANGVEAATITLQLKNENGDDLLIADVEVQFFTSLGTLSRTGVVTTDANGQAVVTLTSTTAGIADVTAQIDTDNDNTVDAAASNGSPVQVTFTAPTAIDDNSTANVSGNVDLGILDNDTLNDGTAITAPSTQVTIDLDSSTAGIQNTLVVSGEGTWTVDPLTGILSFSPEMGFIADPTAISYELTEVSSGLSDSATVTITYTPVATVNDSVLCEDASSSPLILTATAGTPITYTIDYDSAANAAGFTDVTTETSLTGATYVIPVAASANTYNGIITYKNAIGTTGTDDFTITLNANSSIVFNDITKTYGDVDFTLGATSNSPETIIYSILPGGTGTATLSGTNNNTVTLGNAGTVTLRASQAESSFCATTKDIILTITPASLTVSADTGQGKVYGAVDPALAYTITGFVNSDTETDLDTPVSITRAVGEAVGTYLITPSGATDANYTISFVTSDFEITPASLTVSADTGQGKVYGAVDPALTYTITGFVNSDTETDLDTPVSITRAIGEAVGTYLITPSGATDANYTISFVTSDFEITPASLTVSADTGQGKVYGAVDPALTYTITGFQGTDGETDLDTPVSITRAVGEAVGTYLITPSGATDANYTISFVTSDFEITPASLTVSADTGQGKVYGAVDPALTYTITGFVNSDTETDLDTPVSITRAVGEAVGTYLITPSGATDANYTISFVTSDFEITPASLTVSADTGQGKVYGAVDPALTYTITGFVNSDTETDLDTPVSITRAIGEAVGTYLITPSGATDTNYTISFVTSDFEITPASLTVSADTGQGKVYGAVDPALTYTITGFVNSDTETDLDTPVSITRAVGEAVGTYLITPSGATDTNYTISFVTSDFEITPASLTVSADTGQGKVYGAVDPALTYTITGFVNSDTETDLDTPVSITRAVGEAVGTYLITPSGATDANYTISFVTSDFEITPASLTVSADTGQGKVYGAVDPALTYTITGFVNSDTETDLDTPVSITRAVGEAVGTYLITPSGATDANYAISFVTSDFEITPASLTVSADTGQGKVYGAVDPALTYTITGFVNSDTETDLDTPVSITRAVGEAVGTYLITPSGATDANYTISFVTSDFEITPASLTVSADTGQGKVYGAVDPALTYTITGFVNSDTETDLDTPVSITRAIGEAVGTYLITPSGATDTNYTISFVTSDFEITPASLTVSADTGQGKVYGAVDPTLTYTITGFVNSDTETDLDTPVSITRAVGEAVGTYLITPSGATDTNYTISFVTSDFEITPASLTVSADTGQGKVYGAVDPALTYTITGFVNSDTETDLDTPVSITRAVGEAVGTYLITPSGATDANYTISFVTSDFEITPASLTVSADTGQGKVYGAVDPALTYTITGFVNSDTETDLDTPVSITRAVGEAVGTYLITPSGATDANYAISFVTSDFEITPASLTVSADTGQGKVYGAVDPALTYTITGFVNSDTETDLDTPVSITRAVGEAVGTYLITPSGATDANYTISFVTSDFEITPASLTVSADTGQGKVYGAVDPTLTYTITGFVNSDTETDLDTPVSITRVIGEAVGTYLITPSGATDTNYTISFVTSDFEITPASLTVSADTGQGKVYGAVDPALTYTITGFQGTDGETDLDTPVSITRAVGEAVGTYLITPSGATDANYTISFVTSDFEITPASLTVSADTGQGKVYGAVDPALTYTITGFQGTDGETDLDTPVSITRAVGEAVGTYLITPSGATDTNYTISFVTSDFEITPASLTVSADTGQGKVYGAVDPALTYTITGFQGTDGETDLDTPVSITRAVGEAVGTYLITPSGATDANYTISFVTSDFEITPASLTVSADTGQGKVYGAVDPALTYTITGFQGTDGETDLDTPVSITRAVGEAVGTYLITPSGATDANYTISFVTSDFEITPASLTVSADTGQGKVYGAVDPALTYTITGFVNSDTETDLDTPVSITRAVGEAVGTYLITPSGATDTNYTISFVTSDFEITPASLTVSADTGQGKVYGAVDPALTYTITGFVNSDTETDLDTPVSITRAVGEAVGTYLITPSGATDANYTISFVTSDFEITPASLTVSADTGQGKVYGAVDPALTYTITGFQGTDGETDLDTPVSITRAVGEAVGTYLITPSGATDANYTISFVTSDFEITPASLTVSADTGQGKVYGAVDPALTYTITGFVNSDTETDLDTPVSITRAIGEAVGTYLITPSGATDANYTISFVTSDFEITPASLTVSADTGQGKVYGAVDPALTYTITGFQGTDGETDLDTPVSITRAVGEAVGTYLITPSGATDANYTISFVTSDFEITPASLTVSADTGQGKVYGAVDPALTYTITGFVNSDTETDLDTPVLISRALGEAVGTYLITPSGATDANYAISFVTSDFEITVNAVDPSHVNTTLVSSQISIVADGITSTTITLTLAGMNGIPLSYSGGQAVFTTDSDTAVLSVVTDHGNGHYTATITNTVAETVTISATLDGVGVNDTAIVNFTPDLIADTDGDGVLNGNEISDGTDLLDPCDYLLESQDVLIVSDDWLDIDCDGDGIPNGYEISDNDDDGVPDYQEENNAAPNDDGISIFDVMTPNGDGVNDVFVISGIQNFPSNTVKIFSRWGVKVYDVNGYGQKNNFFRGYSDGRLTIKRDEVLPSGTYYYMITYVNENNVKKQLAGYLYINRR